MLLLRPNTMDWYLVTLLLIHGSQLGCFFCCFNTLELRVFFWLLFQYSGTEREESLEIVYVLNRDIQEELAHKFKV
jgi:hypothetical protein